MEGTVEGVRVYSSTGRSNANRCIADFSVHLWQGACIHTLLPYITAERSVHLADIRDIDPDSVWYSNFMEYFRMRYGNFPTSAIWVRLYACFNKQYATLDGKYYSVDLFMQPWELFGSDRYVWYFPHQF